MNKLKVTFYNDVAFEKGDDYKKAKTSTNGGFATGGIYFTTSKAIQDGNPAHIVHGNNGFIYTLGSYVISNSDNTTHTLTYVTENDFKMDNETYFISDIVSDPFEKTLTVTKSKIALGDSFVTKFNELQSFKTNLQESGGPQNKIIVGGKYQVWFDISDKGVFTLYSTTLGDGEFKTYFWDNNNVEHKNTTDAFEIAPTNSGYFYIQAPSTITKITLTTNTSGSFKDDKSIESKILDDDKKTAKITIPNGGWNATSETDKTTFTFTAEIKTQGDIDKNIAASEDTFVFTLKRIESPFVFSETGISYDVSNDISKKQSSKISLEDTDLLTRNFKVDSLDITYTAKNYLSFYKDTTNDIFDSYFEVNTYYLPTKNEKIEFNYSDNTIVNDAYYAYLTNTAKTAYIQLSGAGLWTLELQPGAAKDYVHTYSFCYGTQKNPLDLFKPADTTTATFSHWYLNSKTEPIENITFGSDLFTNYSLRLYAQWNNKSNPITITGEKYSDGIVTTDMSSDTFVLTATANIDGTTFTWEVIEGTDYIKIKEIGNLTSSCRFSLLKWMPENTSCKIKVSAEVGNITTTKEITVNVNPLSQNIILSPTSLSWGESDSLDPKTITVSGYKGTLSVKSSNSNVTATVLDNTVTVTPKVYGQSATITITSGATEKYSANEKEVTVTIAEKAINYYWYAGWTEPSEANIATIVNEEYPVSSTNTTKNKAGGSTKVITGYDKVTPLYYYGDNRFNPGRKQYYLVLPNGIGVYGSDGANSLLDKYSLQESINIPNHKVYKSNSGSSNIAGLMLY